MAVKARNWLFMKRTWLGIAVAAGVLVGVNFPEFWKGFGGGGANPLGVGSSGANDPDISETAAKIPTVSPVKQTKVSDEPGSGRVPVAIKVVIAERSFSLSSNEGERPIDVAEVVELVKRTRGDADGIRLRIYRKPSSRPSAETALQNALTEAGIGEDAVLWVPATSD
ncbi:MAG: hypothetical protein EXS05_01695 [Planctomycetaceae bacterium]|nr:hypothetical protein [Planctomycetaceae bacterium]